MLHCGVYILVDYTEAGQSKKELFVYLFTDEFVKYKYRVFLCRNSLMIISRLLLLIS